MSMSSTVTTITGGHPPKSAGLPTNANYSDVLANLIGSLTAPNPNASPQQQMQQANQANALRGQDILRLLSSQGQTAMANNQQAYGNQLGQIQNDMVAKGLAGTSIGDSLNLGAAKNLQLENNAVQEAVAQQIANTANSFTQQAPNMGLLASLLANGGGSVAQSQSAPAWNVPGGGPLNGPSNLASQGFQSSTGIQQQYTNPYLNAPPITNPGGSIATDQTGAASSGFQMPTDGVPGVVPYTPSSAYTAPVSTGAPVNTSMDTLLASLSGIY